MKKIKIQILMVVILLGKGVSLSGMFSALRGRGVAAIGRPVTSGMSRATAASLVVEQQKMLQRAAESYPDTSTWSGWAQSKLNQFKSLFQRSQHQPVSAPISSTYSRFGLGRRSFSTTIPQRASWWEKFISARDNVETTASQEFPLTLEQFRINFTTIINGRATIVKLESSRGGYRSFMFDDVELERAKQFVEKNEKFINARMWDDYLTMWRQTNYSPAEINQAALPGNRSDVKMLDMVLMRALLFDYENGNFELENTINRLKLAKYIIDKGGVIDPDNRASYVRVYVEKVMPLYIKQFYAQNILSAENKKESLKKLFQELDPVLIAMGYGLEIEKAQQERERLENDPVAYKQDKENREKFMRWQRDKVLADWEIGILRMPNEVQEMRLPNERIKWLNENVSKYIKFDKDQYQKWLDEGGLAFDENAYKQRLKESRRDKSIHPYGCN